MAGLPKPGQPDSGESGHNKSCDWDAAELQLRQKTRKNHYPSPLLFNSGLGSIRFL